MPDTPLVTRSFQRIFCAFVVVTAMSMATAGAQEPDATPDEEDVLAAKAKIPWDTSCSQSARQDEPNCVMSQIVIVPQSRQVLLRLEVRVPGDNSGPNMMLQLPHGIYLPNGLQVAIDEAAWQEAEVQTCDNNGCYAGVDLDAESLSRLQKGTRMTVSFQSLAREVVTVPVDLNGFTEAFGKIR